MQTPQNQTASITIRTLAAALAPIHPADIRAGVSILRQIEGDENGLDLSIDGDCQAILDALTANSFTAALYGYASLLHEVHDGIYGIREDGCDNTDNVLTLALEQLERVAANLGVDVYFDSHSNKSALLVSRASLDPIDRWLAGASSDHLDQSYIRAKTESIRNEIPYDSAGSPPKGGTSDNVVSIDTGRRIGWKDAAAVACTIAGALAFGRFGDLTWSSLANTAMLVCILAPGYWLVRRHAPEMLTNKA